MTQAAYGEQASWTGSSPGVSNVLRYRIAEMRVPRRLIQLNYKDTFDTPGELSAQLACSPYAACVTSLTTSPALISSLWTYRMSYSVYHALCHL